MGKSIGDGLAELSLAIFLVALLWFVFKVGAGFVHLDTNSRLQARCISISGVYGEGKCYVNGNEMFSEVKNETTK